LDAELCRYDLGRAIFDVLFGIKFHKTFGREVRGTSSSCGDGLFPAIDHMGGVGKTEQALWGQGIDVLIIMSDQCDLNCQANPTQQYSKDSFAKGADASKPGGSKDSSTAKKDKYVTAPLKGNIAQAHHVEGKERLFSSACCVTSSSCRYPEILPRRQKQRGEDYVAPDAVGI